MFRRVSLLGPLPPPIGGISSHVAALASRLQHDNVEVRVFDYVGVAQRRATALRWTAVPESFARATHYARHEGSILHLHMSAGRQLVWAAPLLIAAAATVPIVLSVHSGSFLAMARGIRGWKKSALKAALTSATRIVAVSAEIATSLEADFSIAHEKVDVVPAFIPRLRLGGSGRTKRVPKSVTASGYGVPGYGWIELVRAAMPTSMKMLNIVMYGVIDEDYLLRIRQQVGGDSRVCFYFNLRKTDFEDLLDSSAVFVRPTRTDGDSVAVREALAAGCSVIASDVVRRPSGCETFDLDNHDEFVRRLSTALDSPCDTARSPAVVDADPFEQLRRVYSAALRREGSACDRNDRG